MMPWGAHSGLTAIFPGDDAEEIVGFSGRIGRNVNGIGNEWGRLVGHKEKGGGHGSHIRPGDAVLGLSYSVVRVGEELSNVGNLLLSFLPILECKQNSLVQQGLFGLLVQLLWADFFLGDSEAISAERADATSLSEDVIDLVCGDGLARWIFGIRNGSNPDALVRRTFTVVATFNFNSGDQPGAGAHGGDVEIFNDWQELSGLIVVLGDIPQTVFDFIRHVLYFAALSPVWPGGRLICAGGLRLRWLEWETVKSSPLPMKAGGLVRSRTREYRRMEH